MFSLKVAFARSLCRNLFSLYRKQGLALFLPVLCLALLTPSRQLLGQTARLPSAPAPSENGAGYDNRWDIYGGYGYAHFNGIGKARTTNLMGFTAQGTVWIKPVFGVSAGLRETWGQFPVLSNVFNVTNPNISQTVFLFGPDFRVWRTPRQAVGAHLMFGGVYGKFEKNLNGASPNSLSLYSDQLAPAWALGASYDYNLSPRFSIRVITDYEPTYLGSGTQKEFAGSLGVVYKLGSLHPAR